MSDDDRTVQYRDHVHTRKATVAIVAIVAITVLIFAARVDESAGLAGIIGIAMYILGNGVAAYKGQDVQPVIRSRVKYGRRADD